MHAILHKKYGDYSVWWTHGSCNIKPMVLITSALPPVNQAAAMLDGRWKHWEWNYTQVKIVISNLSTSYAITHRGAVRQLNEDAHVEINSHNLWVVADGMGGHEAGEVASQLVVDVIRTTVEKLRLEDLTVSHIVSAIEDANKQLNQYSAQYLSNKTAGSTVTALFVKNERYYILWAGDSRAYLLRNGKLTQVSRDHSQVNDLIDEGMISVEEAKTTHYLTLLLVLWA